MSLHAVRIVEDFIEGGYVQLPDSATGHVGPVKLYPLQAAFLRALIDGRNEAGLRPYRRGLFCVPKKFGKSTLGAIVGLYMLFFDFFHRDRELYSLAGDFDQAMISLEQAKKIIARSPKLAAFKPKVYQRELVFEDEHGVHRWRAMTSDSPTAHGLDPTFVLVDEGWQLHDYALLEAVSLGPQRQSPLALWTSYAGLRSQMVKGQPLFDIYRDGLDGSDAKLLAVYRHGLEAYGELPPGFIRPGYLDEQRTMLPLNRYVRLHLNEWGAEDIVAFTDAEIARATRADLLPTERSEAATIVACDYGRTHDHTAIVIGERIGADRIRISHAYTLQGSPENPVPLEIVENLLLEQWARYRVHRFVIDPFQMLGTAERLSKKLGLPLLDTERADAQPWRRAIVLRPIGPAYLNRLTMALLALFRSGTIEIPAALDDLIAQLGSVVTKETFFGVRIDSGAGVGVRAHDDLVISLGMMAIEAMAMQPSQAAAGMARVERLL